MNTKIVKLDEQCIDDEKIKEAGRCIREGGIVAFPTETVYGLGGNAMDASAVEKIFEAKGRPHDNPLIIHVADFDIEKYVEEVPDVAKKIMERFCPGPITMILKKKDIIPYATSANLETIGVRMPKDEIARRLIKYSGVPIAAPSANISGRPSPTDIESCIEDLDGKVDYILGGKNSIVGVESTIIDCTVSPICILRPGAITLEMLREIDKDVYIDPVILSKPGKDFKPKAPGMKYRHYAPKAPVKIIDGEIGKTVEKINEMVLNYKRQGKNVGIMATDETKGSYNNDIIISLGSRNNMEEISQNLFHVLRAFDNLDVDIILSECFEEKGIGTAIMNRLKKSAGFDILKV